MKTLMKTWREFVSRLRHRLGWNRGSITTEIRDGDIWIGFKCECGAVHHWHKSMRLRPRGAAGWTGP